MEQKVELHESKSAILVRSFTSQVALDSVALVCSTGSVWGCWIFVLASQLGREMWPQAEHCDGADLSHVEFADESWSSDAGDTSERSAYFIY